MVMAILQSQWVLTLPHCHVRCQDTIRCVVASLTDDSGGAGGEGGGAGESLFEELSRPPEAEVGASPPGKLLFSVRRLHVQVRRLQVQVRRLHVQVRRLQWVVPACMHACAGCGQRGGHRGL